MSELVRTVAALPHTFSGPLAPLRLSAIPFLYTCNTIQYVHITYNSNIYICIYIYIIVITSFSANFNLVAQDPRRKYKTHRNHPLNPKNVHKPVPRAVA